MQLPFKGKIVYDGLLEGYDIYIGGNIKAELREIYMAAKQNGMIIESLDSPRSEEIPTAVRKKAKDWQDEVEDIAEQVNKLRSSTGSPPIHSPAFGLAKASIEFTKTAVDTPDDLNEIWKALKKVDRQLRKAATTLNRSGYRSQL